MAAHGSIMEVYGNSIALTQQHEFLSTIAVDPDHEYGDRALSHPYNSDAFYCDPQTGLFVADGVGESALAGPAARFIINGIVQGLEARGASNESPEIVEEIVREVADAVDRNWGRVKQGEGATTLTELISTANPRRYVRFVAGNSRILQARASNDPENPEVVYLSERQSVGVRSALANCFAGEGRPSDTNVPPMASNYPGLSHRFYDDVGILEARPGDVFVLYTDGIEASRNSPVQLDPLMIARIALRAQSAQSAVTRLLDLPNALYEAGRKRDEDSVFATGHHNLTEMFIRRLGDATVAVGRVR